MFVDYNTLSQWSKSELKKFADEFHIEGKTKHELITNILDIYIKLEKYDKYDFISQLGYEGRDSKTFLALDKKNKYVAVKIFKTHKTVKQIKKETQLQEIASLNHISPNIYDINYNDKFIVMDYCDKTLYELLSQTNGMLDENNQKKIINLFHKLDKCKIYHNDPNLCNFMLKKNKWFIIDFGFSIPINSYCIDKYGPTPNIKYMPTGLLLNLKKIYPNIEYSVFEKYRIKL